MGGRLGEILLILVIVLICFGGSGKLKNLGTDLGDGLRNFKKSLNKKDEDEDQYKSDEKEKIDK